MPVANTKNAELNLDTAHFVTSLAEISDVYYGIGNHEERMIEKEFLRDSWEKYYNIISSFNGKHNIYYMDNNMLKFNKNGSFINVFGLNIELKYYQRFSDEKLNKDDIIEKLGSPDKNN